MLGQTKRAFLNAFATRGTKAPTVIHALKVISGKGIFVNPAIVPRLQH